MGCQLAQGGERGPAMATGAVGVRHSCAYTSGGTRGAPGGGGPAAGGTAADGA
eukprot:CAMPEP_0119154536 /NCGR_PEP_ID=MMETSP1310-20130426/50937_1 /TAXON_ID=464262 /ORGANISM="Genus nov. species nov., Strain RCC2339" /LENGTH=52 /DNA_ID=CAMNT_0007147073 /DNA_START=144 /DNA_END=299 /DNA_ORIENTATION=+